METQILQFLEHLQKEKASENTIKSHRLDLLRFQGWLAGTEEGKKKKKKVTSLQQVGVIEIEAYLQFLSDTLKARTVARHISSLKRFFRFVFQQGGLKQNPLDLVRFPEIQYDPPQILSPEQIIALLEAPPLDHYLGLRDRSLLELAYSSGLKATELTALDVEDLFLDLGFVRIRGKKQERMVPLTSKAKELLNAYLEKGRARNFFQKEAAYLFPNRNGQRLTRIGFWFMIKKYAKQAGIQENINPRILRHSFAVHLLQNGMDLDDVKTLFGYTTLDATLQYAHVARPDYQETYHRYHPRG